MRTRTVRGVRCAAVTVPVRVTGGSVGSFFGLEDFWSLEKGWDWGGVGVFKRSIDGRVLDVCVWGVVLMAKEKGGIVVVSEEMLCVSSAVLRLELDE